MRRVVALRATSAAPRPVAGTSAHADSAGRGRGPLQQLRAPPWSREHLAAASLEGIHGAHMQYVQAGRLRSSAVLPAYSAPRIILLRVKGPPTSCCTSQQQAHSSATPGHLKLDPPCPACEPRLRAAVADSQMPRDAPNAKGLLEAAASTWASER